MAAVAVKSLAAGEPPINFAAHQFRAGNIAGAREDFEQMLAMLVAATRPGGRLIAANPGDWGIDVLVGDLSGSVVIWQAKYFWPAVTTTKRAAIRDSFASAVRAAAQHGYRVSRWVLCVPSSMDAPTAKWWDAWRARKQRETNVVIDLWHETELRNLLATPDASFVRRHFYDPYQAGPLPPEDRPVEPLPDDVLHDSSLFVRQLRAAGHVEVTAARREYFNADLMAREIADKGLPHEVAALRAADAVTHGIWEAGFNAARQRVPDVPTLPGLHTEVMRDLRESRSFPTALRAGPVHRCGLMHRIVEDRRGGWVLHWRDIAAGGTA